jgi:hypothetical protein
MLNQWKKHRKRRVTTAKTPSVHFTRARRLGFEAMEGRLMLSGDALEFVSWDAYSSEFRLAIYSLSVAPVQMAPVDYADGGFIQPGTMLFGPSSQGTYDSLTNRANFGAVESGPPITVGFNLSGSSDVTFDFSGVHLDTPSIPVLVFPGTDSDLGTTFVDQPANSGPQTTEVTADEGGAIPINSILAFVGQTDSWKSGDRLASAATPQMDRSNWGMPSVVRTTQAREIAGEWARPAMLEMAGGEPASNGQPAEGQYQRSSMFDDEGNMRVGRPLSSGSATDTPANDSRAARDFNASRRSADAVPPEEAAPANRHLSSTSQQSASLIFASQVADAHSLIQANTSQRSESAIMETGAAPDVSRLNESALAKVYDELGTNDAVGAQAVFNHDAWRDSWKATPLLMILALERIAASNSRRAKKREESASAHVAHRSNARF